MPVEILPLPRNSRSEKLQKTFYELYNKSPEFYIRVPGRVNLIGEHIDYSSYGVCPMALEQDIFLAVSCHNDFTLLLHNIDPKYHSFECPLSADLRITLMESGPQWHQYFLCGLKGILNLLECGVNKGLQVVVSGSVPQNAGLSSSSALVSAAALAAAHAFELSLLKEELADVCAKSERYIGTQGGGMDQAIAFLAQEGSAKFIEFEPLRSTEVRLPSGAVFIIAHSLSSLNKAATDHYNCRVVECRLAAQIIAMKKGLDWTQIKRLGELQKILSLTLDDMIQITKESLKETPYSKGDIVRELNTTSSLLDTMSLTPNTRDLRSFKLYQRALHVFYEAKRVKKFHETCQTPSEGKDSLVILGRLMSDSHHSLKELYECSHPQIDKIVDMARGFTLGTRLTGAGWGGCTVSLVMPEMAPKFIQYLIDNFYKPLGVTDNFDSVIFTTAPKGGACVYTCD
ncbi:N-acetylgalactosamine kinase [Euwallacea similis]|uniref:N-acetylgalactosamine kinase n=1 Tax=Euwallacea similis TaxID=1736056 RepID=UPI00344EFD94